MKIIRSDSLKVQTDSGQREALSATLALYRRLVRDLMTLSYTHWPRLGRLEGSEVVLALESLMHPTAKRPSVRYRYFNQRYYKFPSYLRRVAIMDAVGQVRSFITRYDQWLDGQRKHPHARPPTLTCSTQCFPSLYRGQCIKFSDDGRTAFIKVFMHRDWIWMACRISGDRRFAERFGEHGKSLSPLLVTKSGQWALSVPVKTNIPLRKRSAFTGKVLGVDVGINTAATCAVIDQRGTVLRRSHLQRSDKDREHRLMQRIRSTARMQTRHGGKLPANFCRQDHRRLTQTAANQAHFISRQIIILALAEGCDAISLEALKHWRPKAGRKRSPMKARFHRWFHRKLVACIESKAVEHGIRVVSVYARGTSSLAFDGTGPVRRDSSNYSRCRFASGKHYAADLNAAYNIAARGAVKLYQISPGNQTDPEPGQKSPAGPGNPVTLSTLWTACAA